MEPIAITVRKDGEWVLIHRCNGCGVLHSNRIAGDDNPLLVRIAMRPIAQPPFPLDRLGMFDAVAAPSDPLNAETWGCLQGYRHKSVRCFRARAMNGAFQANAHRVALSIVHPASRARAVAHA
jgi:hypothetical protein